MRTWGELVLEHTIVNAGFYIKSLAVMVGAIGPLNQFSMELHARNVGDGALAAFWEH